MQVAGSLRASSNRNGLLLHLDGARVWNALVAAADVVRFDASDLMYPPVGTGSSFEAMISYTTTGRLSAARQLAQSGYEE